MGENIKELGASIQRARQAAGLTQQQLCQSTGLSYSTLAKIERGAIKTPSVFTVHKIAHTLGCSMDDLLGAVVDSALPRVKNTSKNGISFVYFDVNGCLVQFFHTAFIKMAHDTGIPSDVIESAFWHYNDSVCRGDITLEEFNRKFAERLGVDSVDWGHYYMSSIQKIEPMFDLVQWAARRYKIGLLSNIMPGFIEEMIQQDILPDVDYTAIIDSSQVGSIKPEKDIYTMAQHESDAPSSEILFIDDSRTNLMAAERCGWKVIWFDMARPEESARQIQTALQ